MVHRVCGNQPFSRCGMSNLIISEPSADYGSCTEKEEEVLAFCITIHSMNFPFADDATFQTLWRSREWRQIEIKKNRQKVKQSETRMTTSVLKRDPNKHTHTHKRFKRTLFIMTEHNLGIFGVIPFSSYRTTSKQWKIGLNGEKKVISIKNDMWDTYLLVVELFCCCCCCCCCSDDHNLNMYICRENGEWRVSLTSC